MALEPSSLGIIIIIVVIAFICEFIDSALGMGYGTVLTPILLIMGYNPLQVVPVVLISELISGLSAAFFHHREGNVNLRLKTPDVSKSAKKFKLLRYIGSFEREVSLDLKVALLLAACGILGTILAVFIAVNIPKFWLRLYIGCIVFLMGIIIISCINRKFDFSWRKIIILGFIASFNKGISGGGYGPVVTGGQILSGVKSKTAVGITSLAEGLTCAVGIITYILVAKSFVDLGLAPFIIAGAVASVPFSAKRVKKMTERKLKLAIALLTLIVGTLTILKIIRS